MSIPTPSLPEKPSHEVRAQWAQELAIRGVERAAKKLREKELQQTGAESLSFDDITPIPTLRRTPSGKELEPPIQPPPHKGGFQAIPDGSHCKVAIIGAGAAGLFTGMIFDWLNEQLGSAKFHIDYDILESASTAGGRLFTYNFETGPNGVDSGKHLYYDVGAMRFPDTPIMQRTFDLFHFLGMKKAKSLDSTTPIGALVPYYMTNAPNGIGQEFFHFNSITKWGDISTINSTASSYDPFSLNSHSKIPSGVLANNPDEVMNKAIDGFRSVLSSDTSDSAWDAFMEFDQFSTRQYLLGPKYSPHSKHSKPPNNCPSIPNQPYNWETINWLETFNGGTSWYDQALTETVLESMDFEYPDKSKDKGWYCILGGANVLAQKMQEKLTKRPSFNIRVTGIDTVDTMNMTVWSKPTTTQEKPTKKTYNAVFNSTSLGCMREMNIKTNLNYPTKEAMRSLGYGPSAKVGIKFKRAWWIHGLPGFNITQGGLGHSDLTIRTCVYPSYNYNVPDHTEAVLLCSYTWQQDAERLGSMMVGTNDPNLLTHAQIIADEENLKNLVLRDLAKLHTGNEDNKMKEEHLYNELQESYIDHYAHDWTHDPNTAGAFAFFRPGQFSTLWPSIIQPTNDLIIIGEAASPHHAWVVGALESAVHGVYSWLRMNVNHIQGAAQGLELLREKKLFEKEHYLPFTGLPDYMPVSTADWHGYIGALSREAYLREKKANETKAVNGENSNMPVRMQ